MIDIVTGVKEKEWNRFLDGCYDATIYHTPEWRSFLEKTFHYEPRYLFARNEHADIIGLLPLFHVRRRLTGNRLCSLPFSHECGFVGDRTAYTSLIDEAVSLCGQLSADYLEVRDYVGDGNFEQQNSFSTYILKLSPSVKEVEKKIHDRVRRGIKKSGKNGVSVFVANDADHLKMFYEINSRAKKRLGVPCHPWRFIKNLFDCLGGFVSLYVAEYDGKMIAGGIMERYKDRVTYGYGASDNDYVKFDPSKAFLWKSITDACKDGYKYYDFGRASYNNKGLIEFKKGWGTEEKKLYYSYYPAARRSLVTDRDNIKFKLATNVTRNMPLPLYEKFSDIIIGNFG